MNKKDAILHAAVDIMGEKGFDKTSVSEIVKHAGVAQGTFYLYFQSKSALVLSIAKNIIEDFLLEAQALPGPEESTLQEFLTNLTDLMYHLTLKHKKLIGFIYSGTAYYSAFKEWEALYIPFYGWLEEKLAYYKTQQKLKTVFDLPYLTNYIIGLLEHGAEQVHLMETQGFTEKVSKEQLTTFIYEAIAA